MKILLTAINAKYIHSNLAVYSLQASAGEYKDCVEIAEFTINNQADYILEEIYKRKPDVLMFSCYIWNLSMIEDVMREFHKLCPNARRIVVCREWGTQNSSSNPRRRIACL